MEAKRKQGGGGKYFFNYVVEETLRAKQKPGSSSEQMRLSDVQCALDALLVKHGGAGRSRLCVTYALGLFGVAEDAASLAGNAAPLLRNCLQLLFDCVFSPHMTVIGTQLVHSDGTSLTRAPWFEVCKDLQFELGQQLEGERMGTTDDALLPHGEPARKNVLAQLSVAKEIIMTANEQQNRLQLDGSYVRCITHMMQHLHTGQWYIERRSHLLPPLFK